MILVEKALYEGAVDLLADPAVTAIDEVFNISPIGQGDLGEVAEDVIAVGRRPAVLVRRTTTYAECTWHKQSA